MILNNPEAFSSWLIRQLEPICKANPEPVSKYVCALLKKEKNDGDLRNNLISQLMIFLHTTTEEFVNFLIDALEGDKYVTSDVIFRPSETNDAAEENDDPVEEMAAKESEKVVEMEKERKSPSPIQAPTPSPPKKVPPQRSSSPRSRRNRFRNEKRRVGGGPRRSRRDNSSHSDSPTTERRLAGARRRSASGSSESSTKSPRRSWIASRATDVKKYKHRNVARSPVGQRSRSTSPKLRGKRKPQNGNFRKRMRPNDDSDDERMRVGMKRAPPPYHNDKSLRDLPPETDLSLLDSGYGKKQRCIDFESKGYCARGDMCPFDHGPSPIVLDNNLLNGIVPMPSVVHGGGFPDANLYTPQYVTPPHFPPKPFRPENPAPHLPNRELISVPTVPLPHKMKNMNPGKASFGHIFSSLPPGVSQTTIELTNVPAEQNNIPDLYAGFSKFGNITLIQAKRNGDANTALLTYTNATEAALAFINVSSVLPNAKTAWYADKCILKPFPRKSIPASHSQNNSAKAFMLKRAGMGGSPSSNVLDPSKTVAGVKPPPQPKLNAPMKADPPNASATREPVPEIRRPNPDRLLSELIKKKRDLLEKQLSSRKEIEDKIASLETGSSEEKTWKEVLKKLNDVIAGNESSLQESLQQRKEYLQQMKIAPVDQFSVNSKKQEHNSRMHLASLPQLTIAEKVVRLSAPPTNDSVEEAEKESVDQGSNDLCEGSNVDSAALNHELEDDTKDENGLLRQSSSQAANENVSPSGSGEYTRVVVSGFENGDEEELIQHFSQFGKILDKEIDNRIPSATLIYDNRKSAMEARKDGRNFQDRLLSVTIFSSKRYMPTLKRSAPPKIPEYVPYSNQYSGGSGGGNPYKYKNPQMAQAASTPRPVAPNRSVYSYRAEQKTRTANATIQPPPAANSADSSLKMTEEEDLVTFLEKGGADETVIAKYRD